MKKTILELGKALNKTSQKNILAGNSDNLQTNFLSKSDDLDGGCLSAGSLCHNISSPKKCCGSCEGDRWGICK